MFGKWLSNLSWKKNIFGITGLFMLGIVVEALVAGYTILHLNHATQQALAQSQVKVDKTITARAAILEMGRAQAELISYSDPKQIRDASINAIRASSVLEEAVQGLATTLHGDATVTELVDLVSKIKPGKMEVIKAARANDDARAVVLMTGMHEALARIEDLSRAVVEAQRHNLDTMISQQEQQAKGTHVLLDGIASFRQTHHRRRRAGVAGGDGGLGAIGIGSHCRPVHFRYFLARRARDRRHRRKHHAFPNPHGTDGDGHARTGA